MPFIVGGLDVAELVVYVFFLFFAGLVLWIRREDRREGYPLEEDASGRLLGQGGGIFDDGAKRFAMPFGQGDVLTPTIAGRDPVRLPARRTARFPGAPLEPTGNPLTAGLGPSAIVNRADFPDVTAEGHDRIVPLRLAPEFSIERRDPDPRGWPAVGADGKVAGRVSEVWIDQSDRLIRYLEVETRAGPSVLVPMAMLSVERRNRAIRVEALNAAQFAAAPVIASPDRITRLEEDRVVGYFGGGHLDATPQRAEPIL